MTDQGYVLEPNADGYALVVTGPWTAGAAARVLERDITGLTLNYARGFQERSLGFLDTWPLAELTVLARTIDDVEPVYRLAATLQRLSVQVSPHVALDLRRLPLLTSLAAEWHQIEDTIAFLAGLRDLYVASYAAPDLRSLTRNPALRTLRMKQHPRLTSLDGLQHLPALVDLAVLGARRLSDVGDLTAAPATLTRLDLDSCGALTDLDSMAGLSTVQWLGIGNCGLIASLHPLTALTGLEVLYAAESTRITDGDLTPLLHLTGLQDLRLAARRHYRPTVDDIRAALGMPPWGTF